MHQDKMCGRCGCPHHMMMPILIMLLGIVFLLKALNVMTADMTALVWPIIIILIGLMKMMGRMCKCCGGHCDMKGDMKMDVPKV
ncbi:MAG: DUF5668 domain-containing protein [Candidatus Falkowbacteria bacterium]